MEVSRIPLRALTGVVQGTCACEFKCLAIRIAMIHMKGRIARDSSSTTLNACVAEFTSLLKANESLPSARADLEALSRL